MVKEIKKGADIFSEKALPADRSDIKAAKDLLDTLKANSHICVGMAANMIGVNKRIAAISAGKSSFVMINPVITAHSAETYEADEGCLSLEGKRKTERYEWICAEYLDMKFRKQKQKFSGFTAQITQHEMDHFEGKII
ncbi:MAG: peptide deformylase [Huintestinicola sp.]